MAVQTSADSRIGAIVQTNHGWVPHHSRAACRERNGACCGSASRLECKMVPLSFFEIPSQPRFLQQELIFLSSKVAGVGGDARVDVNRFLSVTEVLILVISSQFLLDTVGDPLLLIPRLQRIKVNGTVKRAGLMLECSQFCTPALIVVSVNRRTLVVLDSSACNYEDHLDTLRRGGHHCGRAGCSALRARGGPTSLVC